MGGYLEPISADGHGAPPPMARPRCVVEIEGAARVGTLADGCSRPLSDQLSEGTRDGNERMDGLRATCHKPQPPSRPMSDQLLRSGSPAQHPVDERHPALRERPLGFQGAQHAPGHRPQLERPRERAHAPARIALPHVSEAVGFHPIRGASQLEEVRQILPRAQLPSGVARGVESVGKVHRQMVTDLNGSSPNWTPKRLIKRQNINSPASF